MPVSAANDVADLESTFQVGDVAMHLIFLSLAGIVILASFILESGGKSGVHLPGRKNPLPVMCSSRMIFGINCPGCGMTRSFIAISRGNFSMAWELNRASFLVYAFVAIQIPWHLTQLLRIWLGHWPIFWPALYYLPIGLAAALILNWMLQFAGF